MHMTYNSLGQLDVVTDFRGNQTTFTYHANGTLASSMNAKGETTSYDVDGNGNTISVEDSLGNVTHYLRDEAGNVIEVTDPKGQRTTMTRDDKGRLLTVTTPLNGTTAFTYTPTGKLATLTDARGKTTNWTYNEQDLVATKTNPLGIVERYFYDKDGLMIQKTLGSGENLTYEYDVNKRLKRVSSPNDVMEWSYDLDGLPLSAVDSDSSVEWNYDGQGRVIKEAQSNGLAQLRFFYDSTTGLLVRRTLGSQIAEVLGYNEEKSLIGMAYQHYGVTRSLIIERDELNRNIEQTFASSGSVNRSFDEMSRLIGLTIKNKSQSVVGDFGFGYDPNSNITSINQIIDGVQIQKTYVYDAENRLKKADHGGSVQNWNLDLLGNWSGNGRIYNDANQLIEDQNFFYSYDPRGNLVQKSSKVGPDVTKFSWDYFDRLVQVELPEKKVSFKYDAEGRRIERILEMGTTTKTRRWTYLHDDQWAETDESGQVLAVTLNGDSVDDVISLSLKDPNQLIPGVAVDLIKDHLGSVHGFVNSSSGGVIQKHSYNAYGVTTIGSSSALLNQLGGLRGYTSREYDKDLKLYYYRARYYDPITGRFLSEDPIGFTSGDTNNYRYVFNNPIRYTDPSGNIKLVTPVTPITSFLSVATGGPAGLNCGEKQELERINQEKNLQNILNQYNTTLPPVNTSPSDVIVITDPNQPVIRQGP